MFTLLVRSTYKVKSISNLHTVARYYSSAIPNPFRCMNALSNDHQRIRSTLSSFSMLVNEIEATNVITSDQTADLHKFGEFITNYVAYHHEKENILYSKSMKSSVKIEDVRLVKAISDEHPDEDISAANLEKIINGLVSPTSAGKSQYTLDDMVTAAHAYLDDEIEHLDEEDQLIYPTITKQLTRQELEQISEVFETLEKDKKDVVANMVDLADELTSKYK
eukprot:CAMPEP_0197022006 /NCGR_PEP_ID=MMETSP1384-20130603/2913_1 /TAXON_ID=29189 /ORGANISM="Ammonia sp." /LENGTH=220 /DNA_ID=CAMNT_0042449963 /DNA_START=21 /DNA_END=683 /DNA_ORIENTATION=+